MKTYSQEEQDQILNKLNSGVIGKRKQGTWDYMAKKTQYSKTDILKDALKYESKWEWEQANNPMVHAAKRFGIYEKATSHMLTRNELTYEFCEAEAKKYTERLKFSEGNSSAYIKALQNGWLDDICKHMLPVSITRSRGKIKWTYDTCKEEAAKYHTRNEFQLNNQRAYKVSRMNKWLDDFFPKKFKEFNNSFTQEELEKLKQIGKSILNEPNFIPSPSGLNFTLGK
jgi:hypothetical protein